ncbi:RHS repeat-associated core domain-containing protein [Microbacterium sp. 22195]
MDGSTSSTNNQTSAIGEGWTLSGSGFIERRYVPCRSEQAPGTPVAGSNDLCWSTDNATISFGSRSGTIVRDTTTGKWRLEGDDNSRVEKLAGTAQGCAANGTYNTECWRLTTTDGTQYFFGLNRLPGWTAGKAETKSAWTVPVFGNDAADPCHAATFAASSCQQGWRWNLDYVVDVNGNAQALYYAPETNKYRLNNTTITGYVRGGQLARIEYGMTSAGVYAPNAATGRVIFDYDAKGRCNAAAASCATLPLGGDVTTPATTSVYPDVPFDLNCTTGTCTGMTGPSFWSTARLSKITTQVFTAGAYKDADSFALTHLFPDPGDGESPALWLDRITRTATAGQTAITEQPTIFQRVPMQNRVWVVDGLAPLDKFRVSSVQLPTGARISVNYSGQECTPAMAPAILASLWSNDKRCFPMWWTPDLDIPTTARQDLFHKYVVTSMIEDPYTGGAGSPAVQTSYVYTGKPAWRYVDDRLIPADRRTWSDYAGYDKVEIRVGDPATPAQQETTQYLFYRGLNGDRANASGGAKSVTVTGTTIADDRWFAGQVRSAKTLNGVGGAAVSETVTTPWASAVTANDGVHTARVLGTSREDTIAPVSTGGTRTSSMIYTLTSRGFVSAVEASAGAGQQATCTKTDYAADNATAWIIGLPSTVTKYGVTCGAVSTAPIPASVLSYQRTSYDGGAVGAAPIKGAVSETSEASGFTGTSLSTAQWVITGQFSYDARGRVTSAKNAAGQITQTAYTPSATAAAGSGPLTSTTVTNPAGWTSSATVDPYRGQPLTAVDENGKATTTEYDALGRLTKVWLTDRPKASFPTSPSIAYEYTVSATAPSSVKQTTLTATSTISSFALVDGLGRPLQSQAPAPGGGAVITDTVYDKVGRTAAVNDKYWAPTVTPGTTLFIPSSTSQIPARSETVYDGAGRVTATLLRSTGTELRRTTTSYPGADRVDVTPPSGGVPTSTWTDAWGRTTRVSQWHGAIGGAGVGSTSLAYEYNGRDQLTRMVDDAGNAWTWTFDLRGRQTASVDPDAGAASRTYDALGNVVTSTDARSKTLAYTYDVLNRKTTERSGSVTGTVLASWAYDTLAKGQVTSSSRFVDGKEYKTQVTGYDDAYRPTGSSVSIPTGAPAFGGTTYATESYYNQDGSINAQVLPAIAGLPYEEMYSSYDTLGNQNSLAGASIYSSQVSYLASGQPGQIVRPGTAWSALTLTYEAGTRELKSLEETTRRNGTVFTREALREYSRNTAGVITKAVTSADGQPTDTQCFTYDALQALTAAWSPAGDCTAGPGGSLGGPAPYSVTYTVDKTTGNRTGSTVRVGLAGTPTTSVFSYPAAGQARPHAVSQVQATTGSSTMTTAFQYDASGGMSKRGAQVLGYDDSGRLASVVDGSSAEKSIYTADGDLLLRYGGSDGASLFLGSTIVRDVAGVKSGVRSYAIAGLTVAERTSGSGGELWWLSPDPVGTVGMQINAATGAVTRRWMDPYGVPRGGSSTWSSNLGYLNAPRSATGLTQLGARAYDPGLGRFVSVDPVLDAGDPRGVGAYAYSLNSPVSYSDPTGLFRTVESADGTQHITPAVSRAAGVSNKAKSTRAGKSSAGNKGRGGFQIAPAAPGNTPASTGGVSAFDPPLTPGDQGWSDALESAKETCSDFDESTPCGFDWMTEQASNTYDLVSEIVPLFRMLRGATFGLPASGGSKKPRFLTTRMGVTIDRNSINSSISVQRQNRHVIDAKEYGGGSYFKSVDDAQRVLDDFHSGRAQVLGVKKNGDIVVKTSSVTGYNNNPRAGFVDQATDVFFIKGTRSPSVVPYTPGWTP